jgi:hypothetical protein
MLCIGLTLVFASASTANGIDRMQHQSDASGEHNHLPFSKIVSEISDHQHESHQPVLDDKGDASDHQSGTGHHHHSDSGPSLPAFGTQGQAGIFVRSSSLSPVADDRLAGVLIPGPERPPKTSANRT